MACATGAVYTFAEVSRGSRRSTKGPQLHAMLFECYFDDSADAKRERFYVCGGLIGSSEQWDWVEGRWSHETKHLREPFRSTDCETGHGQFEDWPKRLRDELMATLVGILRDCWVYGFSSIVPVELYKAAFPNCGEHDPYYLAATQTIINMAHIADELGADVGLWFENGSTYSATAAIFESVRTLNWKPARRLCSIHGESKTLRPLQAADLIARESFKHSDNLGVRQIRKPLEALKKAMYFIRWRRDALDYLAKNGGYTNVELQTTWDSRSDAPRMDMFWKSF